jgi:hypothetical protein
MEAAKLPDKLVKPQLRTLGALRKGETGYVEFTKMLVMSDRSCYLDLNAEVQEARPHHTASQPS